MIVKDVRQVFIEEYGRNPEDIFAVFDPEPIASASLAQVHVAISKCGRKLAVKVQHAGLKETSDADLMTMEFLIKIVRWIFPEFEYGWLVEETKVNLPKVKLFFILKCLKKL